MTKKGFILTCSCIAIIAVCLSDCGNKSNADKDTTVKSSWIEEKKATKRTETGSKKKKHDNKSNESNYIPTQEKKKYSVLVSPNDYEPGNSGRETTNMYAGINDFVLTAVGLTYPELDGMTNYQADTLHLLDNSPNRYGMEYQNNPNCTYLFHKKGESVCGDRDICFGASGWFSRLMDFKHEWAAYVSDLENALRATYPDCSGVKFTNTSVIPDAPTNISDKLAYMDFTVPFSNAGSKKVRLYVEASDKSTIVYSDAWAMICPVNEY